MDLDDHERARLLGAIRAAPRSAAPWCRMGAWLRRQDTADGQAWPRLGRALAELDGLAEHHPDGVGQLLTAAGLGYGRPCWSLPIFRPWEAATGERFGERIGLRAWDRFYVLDADSGVVLWEAQDEHSSYQLVARDRVLGVHRLWFPTGTLGLMATLHAVPGGEVLGRLQLPHRVSWGVGLRWLATGRGARRALMLGEDLEAVELPELAGEGNRGPRDLTRRPVGLPSGGASGGGGWFSPVGERPRDDLVLVTQGPEGEFIGGHGPDSGEATRRTWLVSLREARALASREDRGALAGWCWSPGGTRLARVRVEGGRAVGVLADAATLETLEEISLPPFSEQHRPGERPESAFELHPQLAWDGDGAWYCAYPGAVLRRDLAAGGGWEEVLQTRVPDRAGLLAVGDRVVRAAVGHRQVRVPAREGEPPGEDRAIGWLRPTRDGRRLLAAGVRAYAERRHGFMTAWEVADGARAWEFSHPWGLQGIELAERAGLVLARTRTELIQLDLEHGTVVRVQSLGPLEDSPRAPRTRALHVRGDRVRLETSGRGAGIWEGPLGGELVQVESSSGPPRLPLEVARGTTRDGRTWVLHREQAPASMSLTLDEGPAAPLELAPRWRYAGPEEEPFRDPDRLEVRDVLAPEGLDLLVILASQRPLLRCELRPGPQELHPLGPTGFLDHPAGSEQVMSAALAPGGHRVATLDLAGRVQVRELPGGRLLGSGDLDTRTLDFRRMLGIERRHPVLLRHPHLSPPALAVLDDELAVYVGVGGHARRIPLAEVEEEGPRP
jgi:hypothetical protein